MDLNKTGEVNSSLQKNANFHLINTVMITDLGKHHQWIIKRGKPLTHGQELKQEVIRPLSFFHIPLFANNLDSFLLKQLSTAIQIHLHLHSLIALEVQMFLKENWQQVRR